MIAAASMFIFAAAMAAASMAVPVIVMMATHRIRIILKGSILKGLDCGISISGYAGIQVDTGLGQCGSCTGANAAADQGLHAMRLEKAG